jgi:hypothetical protein
MLADEGAEEARPVQGPVSTDTKPTKAAPKKKPAKAAPKKKPTKAAPKKKPTTEKATTSDRPKRTYQKTGAFCGIVVRVDPSWADALDEAVAAEGMTRTAWVRSLIASSLGLELSK